VYFNKRRINVGAVFVGLHVHRRWIYFKNVRLRFRNISYESSAIKIHRYGALIAGSL
jgi:hypothetical protein